MRRGALHLIRLLGHPNVSTSSLPMPMPLQSISLYFLLRYSKSTHTPTPTFLASFTVLEGRLEADSGVCGGSAACWPSEDSQQQKKPLTLALLASSAAQLPVHSVPCLCPGAGQSTASLAPLSCLEARATHPNWGIVRFLCMPWLGGQIRMGSLAAACVEGWLACRCSATCYR